MQWGSDTYNYDHSNLASFGVSNLFKKFMDLLFGVVTELTNFRLGRG